MQGTLKPLAVDLDGTLIKVDSMEEALRYLLLRKPLRLLYFLFAKLSMGRPAFKWALYSEVDLGPLPYNEELLAWLRAEKSRGRKLLLVSATPQFYVEKIGRRLGDLFDEIIGSTPSENRKSKKKARELVRRFGDKGFDYVGNSTADVAVWKAADIGYNVNPTVAIKTKCALLGCPLPRTMAVFHPDEGVHWLRLPRLYSVWNVFLLPAAAWLGSGAEVVSALLLAGLLLPAFFAANAWEDFFNLEKHRRANLSRPLAEGSLTLLAGWNLAWALTLLAGFCLLWAGDFWLMAAGLTFAVLIRAVGLCGQDLLRFSSLAVLNFVLLSCGWSLSASPVGGLELSLLIAGGIFSAGVQELLDSLFSPERFESKV